MGNRLTCQTPYSKISKLDLSCLLTYCLIWRIGICTPYGYYFFLTILFFFQSYWIKYLKVLYVANTTPANTFFFCPVSFKCAIKQSATNPGSPMPGAW